MEKFVVIDLETTGHSPEKNDKIIETGIVVIENNEITETHATFFNPEQSIPPFIQSLTGITDQDVEQAPTFHEKADEILHIFKDSYFIAHNVPFDLGFLNAELESCGREKLTNPVIDTVELSRILYPTAPGYKLSQLADFLHITHDAPHRALSDAYVTAKIFLKLKKKLHTLPYETILHLLKLEGMLQSDLHDLLYEREQALAFSTEDRKDIVSFQGMAFKKLESTPKPETKVPYSFGEQLDEIYETGGSLEKHLSKYEKREGQRVMSELIFDAFQSEKHVLVEAGTGTGKSLAYLIPAIYEAVKTNERIMISTHTTQLQTQLLEEEIPLLKKILPFPFQAALLKGKNNYLDLEKFAHELEDHAYDNYDIILTKAMLLVWITETETGDIDELNLPSSGYFFFQKVAAGFEEYNDTYSPWFTYSYYQRARRLAQQANIVITNHALLCTDLFNGYEFLPSYKKAIIDEAHHFEDIATRQNGLKIDYTHTQYLLNQLSRTSEDKALARIINQYQKNEHDLPIKEWDEAIDKTKFELDQLFQYIYNYVIEQKQYHKSFSDIGRIQYRFDSLDYENHTWKTIKEMAIRSTFHLRDIIHLLFLIEQELQQKEVLDKHDQQKLKNMMDSIQLFIDNLEHLFSSDGTTQIKWAEVDMNSSNYAVFLYSEPIDISELLANQFFAEKTSIILTSATLTMRNSFSFMRERLGLTEDRLITEKIDSSFSYKDQVKMLVPNDFPAINYENSDEFIYAVCEAILSLAEITKGRMLVLFTSYDMLKKSHMLLKEMMDLSQFVLISQGITSGSRARLKKNFQSFERAILLGTSSFWEGVDIPGEDLSSLVIVKLPFQPPNHPVYEAKAANYKKNGKNAFMQLSLPNAVIKFKQGFGRLIRSESDRGIVFVCDARIITARYGKYFTDSIPEVDIHYDTTKNLLQKAEQWF